MMRACLFSVIALGLFAVVAHADGPSAQPSTTYFISDKGSDFGDGTQAKPWRTLQRAANWAEAGDTIQVAPGSYAGFVLGWGMLHSGGKAGAPITFAAQPGATIVSRNTKTQDAIDLETGGGYVVIRGFTIDNSTGDIERAAIRITGSSHVSVVGNTCQNPGTWGIYASHSDDLLIEGNTTTGSRKQHGIYVSNGADRITIRGNTVSANHNCGIHLNGDINEGGSGVIRDALIENNIIFDNGKSGGSAINCDGVQHSIIRRNLLYGNHSSGISLFREDASEPAKDNVIANNTIVMEANARWDINIQNAGTGNVVRGNILLSRSTSRGSIQISKDSTEGFVSDYNIIQDNFAIEDDRKNLADWRLALGQDQHSHIAAIADVFINPDAHDFHLSKSSPAIAAGAADSPDIGAYPLAKGDSR